MKKLFVLFAAALLMMGSTAFAEGPCYDCTGKNQSCTRVWDCPSSDQVSCYTIRPCDVIFKVCDCVDADQFVPGNEIGVKYTSMTEGAYFFPQEGWVPSLYIDDENFECNGSYTPVTGVTIWDDVVFEDEDEDVVGEMATVSSYDCEVAVDDRAIYATTYRNGDPGGYIIRDVDQDNVWWKLTMPLMWFDWDLIKDHQDEYAQVKVELFLVDPGASICDDCDIICTCIIDAVRICQASDVTYKPFYFQYVLNNVSGWSSGVAVSNIDDDVDIADMEVEVRLIDSAGKVHTGTYSDFEYQVEAYLLETWIEKLEMEDVADGAAVIYFYPNFDGDGYMFNLNIGGDGNMFGASVLSRFVE